MLLPLSKCTGCSACMNVCPQNCISMEDGGEGFLYPEINSHMCINCGLCKKVCPVLSNYTSSAKTLTFAIKNKNEIDRFQSTSGGVFSLLAEYVLNNNGIVYGAAYDEDFSVHHVAVKNIKEISYLQGAKYVQSKIGNCFENIRRELEKKQIVLFSGTPCQCVGLKTFLRKEYDNLILVDLICHGVPSPKVWQAYIDYRANNENAGVRPIGINMRSKVSGWSKYGYSTEFNYGKNNITRTHNSQDLFMKAFIENICLRKSCSHCLEKGVERCTDFTLGDFWGIWNQYPDLDDDKGTSVVFVHSEKGKLILNQIKREIDYFEVNAEDACKENASLIKSSVPHKDRDIFLAEVNAANFEKMVNKYLEVESSQEKGLMSIIKAKMRHLF